MKPFSKRPYPSFVKTVQKNWGYILEKQIAQVWVGEFGAPDTPDVGDRYWPNLMRYLEEMDADVGYWAINPRKPRLNKQKHYSLVQDDWDTVLDDYRLRGHATADGAISRNGMVALRLFNTYSLKGTMYLCNASRSALSMTYMKVHGLAVAQPQQGQQPLSPYKRSHLGIKESFAENC
ncbi:MAG: hypothetical protein Q9187_002456 [Circinaria calcarea]